MLGDFQYYSSSSEDSNSDDDSDSSSKSEDNLEKLHVEQRKVREKIASYEENLKAIHGTLKALNEERNKLLLLRSQLITSSCLNDENSSQDGSINVTDMAKPNPTSFNNYTSLKQNPTTNNVVSGNSNHQPLNLEVLSCNRNNDDEEFDSD